jgi:hypothetical protein
MKSFNQFLQESYLSEEPAGRERSPKEQAVWDEINKKEAAAAERKANRKPSGAAADPSKQFKPQAKTTKVASPARKSSGAAADPWKQFPKKPQQQLGMPKTGPSSSLPGRTLAPAGGTTAKPSLPAAGQTQKGGALATTPKGGAPATNPPIQAVKVSDVTKLKGKLPSGTKGGELAAKPSSVPTKNPPIEAVKVSDVSKPKGKLPSGTSSATKQTTNAATKAATKTVGKGILKGLGKIAGPASAALDVADELGKGSGPLRALAKGAVVAAGGALGGAGGSVAGPVGTVGGAVGGSMAASKAFDVVAGKNAKERAADRMANRQRQAGTAVKGIGGKTTFSQTKPGGAGFMSTGSGAQRKTVQLAKTGVVQRGGKSVAGDLAFKTDSKGQKQAVYKAPSAPGTGSKNPLENAGRFLFPGAYKKSDAANAAKKLATAKQSDAARNKALGVKFGPGK